MAGRYGFKYKTYVSAGIGPVDGRGDHWVVFTERPPAEVFNGLATLGTDTVVMYGAPASGRELRRLSRTVMQSLTKGRDVFAGALTGTDRYGRFVTVTYSFDPALPEPADAALDRWKAEARAAGAARFPDARAPVPVRFLEGPPGGVLELQ